jgi:hypothetical protein
MDSKYDQVTVLSWFEFYTSHDTRLLAGPVHKLQRMRPRRLKSKKFFRDEEKGT